MSILTNLQKLQSQGQKQEPVVQTPQMTFAQQKASENTKWWAGERPTMGETLKRIGGVYATNQEEGRKLFSDFKQKMGDPSSLFYSPYMTATNTNTRNAMAAYGIDASNVNDDWFIQNAWLKQYNRIGSTGNVLGTANSATPEQNAASLYNDLYEQHENTKKAKTELDAVLNAVRYWAGRDDLNLSDEEILGKIDWDQYPTLKKMDEAAKAGAPMYTTSAVGYDKDLLYGAIYQGRNNGGSNDLMLDSANYYGGSGIKYVKNDATRAKMTYGSSTYNPYAVSGTINDLGLYFGQKSFDREWLDANADILNGNDETAKKNYHKVQAAVEFSDSVEAEMAALYNEIDRLVNDGADADRIVRTVENLIDSSGKFPSLDKLQESLETGKLLDTAYKSTFDMPSIRQSINDKVKEKKSSPEQNNVAHGGDIVSKYGSEEEKAFFDSYADLDFDEQLETLWLAWNSGEIEGQAWLNTAYSELADTFNQKWVGSIDDTVEGYANYCNAVSAASAKMNEIENSEAFKKLRELGYEGKVNDYTAIYDFLQDAEKVSNEDYEIVSALEDQLKDLAPLEYNVAWYTNNGIVGKEYAADYSALETFRRRAGIMEDASVVPLATKKEDYSFVDNAGLTADFMIGELMKGNAGLSGADASKALADFYTKEKARLESDIAKAEKLGYDGKNIDNKKRKLAWYDRMLADIGRYNLQYQPDFAEKVEEGKNLVNATTFIPGLFDFTPQQFKKASFKDGKLEVEKNLWNLMEDSEKNRLYYLMAKDPKEAEAYFNTLTDDTYGVLTYRQGVKTSDDAKAMADAHPVWGTIVGIASAPFKLEGTAYSYIQGLQGKEINPYSEHMATTTLGGQSYAQVIENIDEATQGSPLLNFFAKAGYSAFTSGVESMLFGTLGKAGLPFMVGSGASATIQSAIDRGADPTEAMILGGMSALIEYGTEKIPFDALQGAMKGDAAAKETFKDWFVRTARDSIGTGMQDATGEAISEFAGNIVDQWLMGDRSNHAAAVEKWIADNGGLMAFESPEEAYAAAEKAVTNEELIDVASAFVAGFLSSAGSVAVAETGNRVANKGGSDSENVDSEKKDTALPDVKKDDELLRKQALIMSVTAKGGNNALAIANALKTSTDATLTIAKATALDMQKVFGKDTGKVLADILGAAHDAGVSSDQLIRALRSSLAEGNSYGRQALDILTKDGATVKKVQEFVQREEHVNGKYSQGQARGVLLGQYEQEIMQDSASYESLKGVTTEAKNAQDKFHHARFDVGVRTKEATAAAESLRQAFDSLNQSMTNPNANEQASIQHAYFNAVDNMANVKSALFAATQRAIEAKKGYDAAMIKLEEANKNWMATVRKKASEKLETDLQNAEQKSVDELKDAAKPVQTAPKNAKPTGELARAVNKDDVQQSEPAIDEEAIRAGVIEEMRNIGLLDELTDLNREIEKIEKQIAGNRSNDKIRRPLDKLLKQRTVILEGLKQDVEALVVQEVQRIEAQYSVNNAQQQQAIPIYDGMTRAVNKDNDGVAPASTTPDMTISAPMDKADTPLTDIEQMEPSVVAPAETVPVTLSSVTEELKKIGISEDLTIPEIIDRLKEAGIVDDLTIAQAAEQISKTQVTEGLQVQNTTDKVNVGIAQDMTIPQIADKMRELGIPENITIAEAVTQLNNAIVAEDIRIQQQIPVTQQTQGLNVPDSGLQQVPIRPVGFDASNREPAPPMPVPPTIDVEKEYSEAVEKYGTINPGETPARPVYMPTQINDEQRVSQGFRTYGEAYTEAQVPMAQLHQTVMSGLPTYTRQSNAEQIQHAENIINERGIPGAEAIWANAIEGGRIPTANEMAVGAVLVDRYVNMGNVEAANRIAAEFAVAATAAGQSVQATRIIKQLSGAGGVHYFNRVVNRLNAEYANSGRVITLNSDLVNKYALAKTPEERERIADEINEDLARQLPFTLKDFAKSWRYMSMLSSPKTSITNLAGNAANLPLAFAKDVAGAFLDQFRAVDKRTHSAVINGDYLNYVKQRMAQEKQKAPEGNRYDASANDIKKLRKPFGNVSILNKAYGAAMKPLEWGDAKFKSLYYPRILAGYLQAKKVNLSNVSKEMWAAADAYATEQTLKLVYQDNNAIVKAVNELANKKYVGPIFSVILPFTKTPINIAKTAIEYHPIGAAVNAIYQGKKNGWNSEQVVDAAAKGMAGALPVLLGFALRAAGILTTSLGDDPEDKLAKQRGSQAYALELGDKSFSISWMGPLSMLMNFGASIADASDGELTVDDLSGVGMGTLEVLTDLSLLSGVVDLFEVSQYVQGDTPAERFIDYMAEAATQVGGNYVGQFVPSALGSVARTIDTTRRSTTTDPNSPIPESLQYQLYKLRNKIPGLSTLAPAYTDEFGRTEEDSYARAFLENFIVPGYVNDLKKDDPVLNAVDEVYRATGIAGVVPKNATKSFSESGVKHKISGDDYARLNTKRGHIIYDTLSAMIQSEEWKQSDALIRAEMIQDVYNYADNASRVDFVTASPFSEKWQQDAYRSGNPAESILGRAEEYAKSAYGELYASELSADAIGGDWESVANKWMHLTTMYPFGAGLTDKQAKQKIESELKAKLQEGNADVSPEEYEAVMELFNLGMIDYTLVDELLSR